MHERSYFIMTIKSDSIHWVFQSNTVYFRKYNIVEDSKPASYGVRIYCISSHVKGKQ